MWIRESQAVHAWHQPLVGKEPGVQLCFPQCGTFIILDLLRAMMSLATEVILILLPA